MKALKRLLFAEQGSTIVLAGLSLVVLLAIAALVMDGGTLFATKSHLQKTANAAALSGAQELTNQESAVKEVVQTTVHNHREDGSLQATNVEMGKKVTVQLRKEVPLAFSKLLGLDRGQVAVKAAAEIQTMGAAIGAAPLGIDESIPLEYYKTYKLKVDQTEQDTGYFGVLALGGPGASTYEDNLKYGYKNMLQVGDIIDTQTGNIAGKTRDGIKLRIDQCPYTPGDYDHRDCPRIILIPVYEPVGNSSQLKQVKITGFAYFYITEPMDSKATYITGMFIKRAGTGIVNPDAVNRGAYAIKLVE